MFGLAESNDPRIADDACEALEVGRRSLAFA
jgi:hypothetical protein